MKTTDLTLLPLTVYGTPSGNYDGSSDTAFAGDRQKAADYYVSGLGIQSVRFKLKSFINILEELINLNLTLLFSKF